jgi:hypothetical protein
MEENKSLRRRLYVESTLSRHKRTASAKVSKDLSFVRGAAKTKVFRLRIKHSPTFLWRLSKGFYANA